MQDAAKKPREYLVKIAQVYAISAARAMFFVLLGVLAALVVILPVNDLYNDSGRLPLAPTAGLAISVVGIVGWVLTKSIKIARRAHAEVALHYVPPVREHIASLPADDVLLRGSDVPVAESGELLRAAQDGTKTATEDLLRPIERRKA